MRGGGRDGQIAIDPRPPYLGQRTPGYFRRADQRCDPRGMHISTLYASNPELGYRVGGELIPLALSYSTIITPYIAPDYTPMPAGARVRGQAPPRHAYAWTGGRLAAPDLDVRGRPCGTVLPIGGGGRGVATKIKMDQKGSDQLRPPAPLPVYLGWTQSVAARQASNTQPGATKLPASKKANTATI